jgi:hypothetical protein
MDAAQVADRQAATEHVCQEIADEIWTYLDRNHRGHEQAITEKLLAQAHGLNPRVLQEILEHLIVRQERPIASSCRPPMGVFVAQTAEEKAQYALQLENRIIGLARRRRAFTKAPLVKTFFQERIFDGGKDGPDDAA